MSNYLDKWKNFLKEGSQWGGFTGGAAPLDEPTPDSGPIPPEQLRKMWSIYTEMGMSPEEILQTPEFVEAGIVSPEQLQEDDVRDTYETFIFPYLTEASLEDGTPVCTACLYELLDEASCDCPHLVYEAEYRGRKVKLNKPTRGDVKKFKVYVKDPKTGNVKKVNFGDPNMRIKKSNPKRRKSFRARHNCDNPGPKTKARYWSCKKW